MTPEEKLLRDAYLSECWPTVREYREGDPPPKRHPRRRPENVDKGVDTARKGAA